MVARSVDIETREEALAYYATLTGDHRIVVSDVEVTIRFVAEEIHPFTVSVEEGRSPPESSVVRRPDKSGETRIFSRQRARLLDEILPTLSNPVGCVPGTAPKSLQVYGPANKDGQRLAVVLIPHRNYYIVRTAFPLSREDFAKLARKKSRPLPWPPK